MADGGQQAARQVIADADAEIARAEQLIAEGDRRQVERRGPGRPPTGRRAMDRPANAWSTGQMAYCVGMTTWFVVREIEAGEIKGVRIGREYRIPIVEVRRYLQAKGFPVPAWMHAA